MRGAAFTLLVLCAACGGESAPPPPDLGGGGAGLGGAGAEGGAAGSSSVSPETCGPLDETACQGTDGCEALRGWNGMANVYAGCRFARQGGEYALCDAVLTCAFPVGEPARCLRFASSCVPSGWTVDEGCTAAGCPPP